MRGFQELARKIHTEPGLGLLRKMYHYKIHAPITVDDILDSEDLETLQLQFEHGNVYLLPKNETCQLEIHFNLPISSPDLVKQDISNRQPWATVARTELFTIWALQTEVDDYDALQLSFAPIDDPRNLTIQLESMGSSIRTSLVVCTDD